MSVKKFYVCKHCGNFVAAINESGVPIGATQGSMAGLGYSQSWTISNGSTGEMYLSKLDKELLGYGNRIGSYSPVQELTAVMSI